jgi:hypothetical protein
MKIVFIAWGSLVWDNRDLPIKSEWYTDGPKLPIEFSRVSKDARLTLVIDSNKGVALPTRYSLSSRSELLDAIADLRVREGTVMRHIGFTDRDGMGASYHEQTSHKIGYDSIIEWLRRTEYDAAVWTALPSNYLEQQGCEFSINHAVSYLQRLPKSARENALDYIRRAPQEVSTPLRAFLTKKKLL